MAVPIRTKYLGSFTSNPTPTEAGQWWYREDLGQFCFWDGSSIGCWGAMGGKLAEDSETTVYSTGGNKAITVRISGLSSISYLLNIRFHTSPKVDSGNPINELITGNVVGFTLVDLGGGTTLTSTVTVIGT